MSDAAPSLLAAWAGLMVAGLALEAAGLGPPRIVGDTRWRTALAWAVQAPVRHPLWAAATLPIMAAVILYAHLVLPFRRDKVAAALAAADAAEDLIGGVFGLADGALALFGGHYRWDAAPGDEGDDDDEPGVFP